MADGGIADIEPRREQPAASPAPPPTAREGVEAVENTGAGKRGADGGKEPIRELIDKLERTRALVERADAPLAATIKAIAEQANTPGKLEDAKFRTRVAYALQDVERLTGPVAAMPQDLREEMTRLAATYPGLGNERMQELVRGTPGIGDRNLVRDIRGTAARVAGERDQASPDVQSQIDVLANRARLGARGEEARQTGAGPTATSGAQATKAAEAMQPAVQPGAISQDAGKTENRRGDPAKPAWEEATVPPQGNATQHPQQRQVGGPGATVAIMAALRRPEPAAPAPWDQQLTPLSGRLAKYMETAQANRDEAALGAAERSGQAAVQALQAFAAGPGAGIMAKVQAAGKNDPDGVPGVIAGMREGGPYQDLRRGFNADLQREKGLAAALDRAAAAVGQYGAYRAVADGIAAKQADASVVVARFDKLDAEVGKAAATTPGRKEGKSQLGELVENMGEKVSEIAKKAAEAVREAFKRAPGAEHRASGPSPSM